MNVGVDIEEVTRFALSRSDPFVKENFSPDELSYAYGHSIPEQHLCGMFCAKEAVRKLLEQKSEPLPLSDITIQHADDGKPHVLIDKKKTTISVSISHTRNYAVAVAIGELNGRN